MDRSSTCAGGQQKLSDHHRIGYQQNGGKNEPPSSSVKHPILDKPPQSQDGGVAYIYQSSGKKKRGRIAFNAPSKTKNDQPSTTSSKKRIAFDASSKTKNDQPSTTSSKKRTAFEAPSSYFKKGKTSKPPTEPESDEKPNDQPSTTTPKPPSDEKPNDESKSTMKDPYSQPTKITKDVKKINEPSKPPSDKQSSTESSPTKETESEEDKQEASPDQALSTTSQPVQSTNVGNKEEEPSEPKKLNTGFLQKMGFNREVDLPRLYLKPIPKISLEGLIEPLDHIGKLDTFVVYQMVVFSIYSRNPDNLVHPNPHKLDYPDPTDSTEDVDLKEMRERMEKDNSGIFASMERRMNRVKDRVKTSYQDTKRKAQQAVQNVRDKIENARDRVESAKNRMEDRVNIARESISNYPPPNNRGGMSIRGHRGESHPLKGGRSAECESCHHFINLYGGVITNQEIQQAQINRQELLYNGLARLFVILQTFAMNEMTNAVDCMKYVMLEFLVAIHEKHQQFDIPGEFENRRAKVMTYVYRYLFGLMGQNEEEKKIVTYTLKSIRKDPYTLEYLEQLVKYANDLYRRCRILRRDAKKNNPINNIFMRERVCKHLEFTHV
jgi:ElaB/YqjD/DUF883 family membrane-anchored ribosome-binding protein